MKNFKSMLTLLVIATIVTAANAQSPATTTGKLQTTIGIKGGANLSNLYVNDVKDENAKIGFQAGLFVKAPITKFFSIQPELIYSQKGSQLEYNNLFATGTAKFNLHYVELPVMAVINLGNHFNLQAGPYIAYLAGVTTRNKGTSAGQYDFEKNVSRDNFETLDYGVAGGFGFDADKVGVGVRYNYGLQEVGKEQTVLGQPYRFNNGKNSVLQVYLTLGL